MSKSDRQFALLIAADRVVAARGEHAPGSGANVAVFPLPPDLAGQGHSDLGRWLRHQLHDAGFTAKRCEIAMDRSDVLVKRLTFAALPSDHSDLTNMVGLQVTRQIVAPPGGLRVDYLPSERPNDPSVLAAGVPSERIESVTRVARAAGLQVTRVAPLSCGFAAVARSAARGGDGARLIVAPAPMGVEFLVIDSGEIMLSRWVATPTAEPTPEATGTRWVAMEARRTLMSHSADAGARPVSACAVIGSQESSAGLMASIVEVTGLSCDVIGGDQISGTPAGDAAGYALAGLLAEGRSGLSVIDLEHPRKPVDKAARRRQAAMAAAFGLIVVVGGVFSYGSSQLRDARKQLEAIEAIHTEQSAARLAAQRDVARLDHILRWQESSPDWLTHLATIGEVSPPGDGVVRELRGSASRNPIAYSKKGGAYDATAWSVDPSVSMVIKGLARSTDAAERVRGAFVDDARYTVFPAGQDGVPAKDPDFPIVFGMDLQSGGVAKVIRPGAAR